MKSLEKIQCLLFIVMLFVCLASTAVIAADLPDAIGEVVSVVGIATATQPDGDMRTLAPDARVVAKDVICTGWQEQHRNCLQGQIRAFARSECQDLP